nr:MAG TPA: hypothetical protein [Caudoviricetes sp.]
MTQAVSRSTDKIKCPNTVNNRLHVSANRVCVFYRPPLYPPYTLR